MDKNHQKLLEMSLLSNIKGEGESPFNNSIVKETDNESLQMFEVLKYLEENYSAEYKENKSRFILMIEELFPLSVSQIVEWGEVSLKEQKEAFQNTTLLIKEYASINSSTIINDIINRKKDNINKGFINKIIRKIKYSKESEDRNNISDLKQNLSALLLEINQGVERLSNNYIKQRLIILICIDEADIEKSTSLSEVISNRRQLFFYALQNIEVSRKQLEQTRDFILNNLVSIDHIENVTIPLLYRTKE